MKKRSSNFSDITLGSGFSSLPLMRSWILLMRLDRPIGIWLTLASAIWGLFIGNYPYFPKFVDILLFILGAVFMRGAGCIINDLFDRNIDAHVQRTSIRPLASKSISLKNTFILLSILLLLSFFILVQFNLNTIFLGFLAIPLIVLYPLMKRITYWPQLFLGIIFNWGFLLGSVSGGHSFELSWLLLYGGAVCWTLGYDTIYAYQDIEDDILVGIKSTAIKYVKNVRFFLLAVYGLSFCFFYGFGEVQRFGFVYKAMCIIILLHFLLQVLTLDLDNPKDCLNKFKSNIWVGGILLCGLAFETLMMDT